MGNTEMGRPAHEPTAETRKKVESYAAIGILEEDIAKVIGVCPKVLRKYYRDQLDLSFAKANAAVAGNLYKIATGNSQQAVIAAIFWCKTRMGWRDVSTDGGAQRLKIEIVGGPEKRELPRARAG